MYLESKYIHKKKNVENRFYLDPKILKNSFYKINGYNGFDKILVKNKYYDLFTVKKLLKF